MRRSAPTQLNYYVSHLILQWLIKQVTGYGSILLSSRENLGLMVGPTAADGGVDLVFASTDVEGSSPVTYTLFNTSSSPPDA